MTVRGTQIQPDTSRNSAGSSPLRATEDFACAPLRRVLTALVPISVATRRAHLTAAVIEALFCDHYRLHPSGTNLQPGPYATIETVNVVGPQGRLRKLPIVGPPSAVNQIEISRSDAAILGIRTAVRESGDLIGTPGVTLEGPRSRISIGTGVICPQRHVRMGPDQALGLNLKDRGLVEVSVQSPGRNLRFRGVPVRVAPDFALELVLDSDDAKAAGVRTGDYAQLFH